MLLYTTLERMRNYNPCIEGWRSLLRYLNKSHADSEPLEYFTIYHAMGFEMTLWACQVEPRYNLHWQDYVHWAAANCVVANEYTLELLNQPPCIAARAMPWNSQSALQRLLSKSDCSQAVLPITQLLLRNHGKQLQSKFLEIIQRDHSE